MNIRNRILKVTIAALLSTLMAGSAVCVLLTAMNVEVQPGTVYIASLVVSLIGMLVAFSRVTALVGLLVGAGGAAVLAVQRPESLMQVKDWLAKLDPTKLRGIETAHMGALPGILAATVLALLFYILVYRHGSASAALAIELVILIASYAMCADVPLWMALPGLAASVVAFAWSGPAAQDMLGGWRALLPAILAVAIAFSAVPVTGTTWKPMKDAAETVRRIFSDYFNFTEERVPYTLYSKGFDHVAEVNDELTVQLGGEAHPSAEEDLKVVTDTPILLRGSVYRTYTGSAWTDHEAKKRYLYYDVTRKGTRVRMFNQHDNTGLQEVTVQVEVLQDGTSALFVPTRMQSIETESGIAVYYNSIGETFLARQTKAGDRYTITGYVSADAESERTAVLAKRSSTDRNWKDIQSENTQLPEGIEQGVYDLVNEITDGLREPYDKVKAIGDWLSANCLYTLKGGVPEQGTDFVSEFVLRTRRGYCSYFASAMTVMCRIAGVPARYVEGYAVQANADGEPTVLTGNDAHAWTEVYFNGIGWMSMDVSNGAVGYPDGAGVDDVGDGDRDSDQGRNDPAGDESDPTPSPEPDPQQAAIEAERTPTPPPAELPQPHDDTKTERPLWQWILAGFALLLLILLAIALWILSRLRRTDPIRLSENAGDDERAAVILYRSILTLLAQMGQTPMNGETPGTFARRVSAQLENADFEAFTESVTMRAYANRPIDGNAVEAGTRAYRAFLAAMKPKEKRRFLRTRIRRGLGSFDVIP